MRLLGDCESNSPNNSKTAIETSPYQLLEKNYQRTVGDALRRSS